MSSESSGEDTTRGYDCVVDGCENTLVSLDDGWEFGRGHVCAECIEHQREHGYWPDEEKLVTDGGRPSEAEMLDVELVLGAGRLDDHQVRLDVTTATVVDREEGRLEISLAGGGMDEYLAELGLKNRTDEFATDGGRETAETQQDGLHGKYEVYEGGERVEDCFVLEPENDTAARHALAEYADVTDNPELADDLREWVASIEMRYLRGESDG